MKDGEGQFLQKEAFYHFCDGPPSGCEYKRPRSRVVHLGKIRFITDLASKVMEPEKTLKAAEEALAKQKVRKKKGKTKKGKKTGKIPKGKMVKHGLSEDDDVVAKKGKKKKEKEEASGPRQEVEPHQTTLQGVQEEGR